MKRKVFVAAMLLVASGSLSAQSVYPGQHAGKLKKETVAPMQVRSFDLKDVRLLPSRFRENMMRDSVWMASIDVDRLLHSFRTNAGMFAGREGGYMTVKKLGGWESLDCELRGHTTGHLLSAYGLMYAATGSELFKQKGDSLVNGLAEVQTALGNGYLSAYPEELINRNIRGTSVWAPWYTLHKLFSGLIDQYLYSDNQKALEVVVRMADWAYHKLKPLDEATRQKMIRNEFGGVNESFYNLYAITGDERHRWLAQFFYHNEVIDPLKKLRDDLGTKHTNTFIPKVIAEARNYELTEDENSKKLSDFFWHTMIDHHTFAPGCSSDKEHYFDPARFSKHVSGYTGETCCTYNMLKLSRHLFCWTADAAIADYYERALYNHILGQQDPQTGMVTYFLPLLSGSHKVYSTKENSFWCCVGSGFENHAKYGEAIYYHNDKGIYVNLFIPSVVNWKEKGLTLRQETDFPAKETTVLTMETQSPVETTVYLRYPSWSKGVKVAVNGKKVAVKQKPGSYIAITRLWKDGDRITADYPMCIRVETTPDNPQKGALVYGPVVLAGKRGTEGMQAPAPDSNPALYNDYYTYDYHIPAGLRTTLKFDVKHPERSVWRVSPELKFTTSQGDVIEPLYNIHRQRYVVYWDLEKE
ncbi:glycoside hydrolase family 127 protein [Phocaeicola sartorii]|uniref:glycoside hydrolase family 127 protein n=1 Tax=Phocaeicola sartorii TaxID=671267 RepID=UPI003516E1C2